MRFRIILQNPSTPALLFPVEEALGEDHEKPLYQLGPRHRSLVQVYDPSVRLQFGSNALEYAQPVVGWLRTSAGVLKLASNPLDPSMAQNLYSAIERLLRTYARF
ncbi:hypothetical protein HOF92_03805 [bacterium]|jgi:hypothetical protein|nr:hypothetical protein [bacterium]